MLPPAATNDNQESKLTSLEESKQNKNDLPVDDVLKQSIGESNNYKMLWLRQIALYFFILTFSLLTWSNFD